MCFVDWRENSSNVFGGLGPPITTAYDIQTKSGPYMGGIGSSANLSHVERETNKGNFFFVIIVANLDIQEIRHMLGNSCYAKRLETKIISTTMGSYTKVLVLKLCNKIGQQNE